MGFAFAAAMMMSAPILEYSACAVYEDVKLPADTESLDNTCIGYGQGRDTDDMNRPYGAVDFNARYGRYGAYAISDDDFRLVPVSGSDKSVCLTFDQGYENGYTASVLDTLKEKNVKAVFFLTGDYASREQELVKRMIDEGHIIGNHGMKHASLPSLSCSGAVEEILSLHDYVKDNYNYEMKLFRPPCGEYSEQKIALVNSLGYRTLFWSFAYCDWDVNNQPDAGEALKRTTEAAHDGAVYLLHSVSATNCEILPKLIDDLRSQGYEFSVPQLTQSIS